MKAKEVVAVFDAACRRLKKHFGAEADTIFIRKLNQYPNFRSSPWSAICKSSLSSDFEVKSELLIHPNNVLSHLGPLSNEILRTTIIHTACHEMAHHLSRFRMAQIWKQELAHLSSADRFAELKSRHYAFESHGSEWRSIMENEMSVSAHTSLTPYPELCPLVGGI